MKPQEWIPANRRRVLLAAYLDYCLFTASVGLLAHFAYVFDPVYREYPLYLKILVFIVIEYFLLARIQWSPGSWLLSVRLLDLRDYISEASRLPAYLWRYPRTISVDAWVKDNETWFSLAMGVLMVNEGSKSLVRWTMWMPPSPEFGIETSETVSATLSIAKGGIELFLAWAILRLMFIAVPVAVAYCSVGFLSMWMSWSLWDSWVVEYVTRRRTFQGLPVQETEIEQMQAITPEWQLIFFGALIILFLLLAIPIMRARRSRETE